MTHDSLEKLIALLNSTGRPDRERDRIFIRPLTPEVDFARIWCQEPRGGVVNEGSDRVYFIKADARYVAAVLDMDDDLHAFTLQAYRGRGLLIRAMDTVILPRLWQEGRVTQKVTFKDHDAGARFARRLGFTITGLGTAEKDLSVYATAPRVALVHSPLSRDEYLALEIDLDRAKLYLKMIKERLDLAYGATADSDLERLVYQDVGNLDDRINGFLARKLHEHVLRGD